MLAIKRINCILCAKTKNSTPFFAEGFPRYKTSQQREMSGEIPSPPYKVDDNTGISLVVIKAECVVDSSWKVFYCWGYLCQVKA